MSTSGTGGESTGEESGREPVEHGEAAAASSRRRALGRVLLGRVSAAALGAVVVTVWAPQLPEVARFLGVVAEAVAGRRWGRGERPRG
ncbi:MULTISPECIES: hypothetical protein [unclassified Streptomyces]|uniref:hypothetical protein n=1 Tax=unclassified Streptomyces TaxID=2593676 RepID=UPI00364C7979